jgi:hypothetical protein
MGCGLGPTMRLALLGADAAQELLAVKKTSTVLEGASSRDKMVLGGLSTASDASTALNQGGTPINTPPGRDVEPVG